MREIIEIGATPCNEDCAQVGEEGYGIRARAECRQFIKAIIRKCGEPPEGASLWVKKNPHDFGSYYEVAVCFDADDEKAAEYAYRVESEAPTEWTEEDRAALKETP